MMTRKHFVKIAKVINGSTSIHFGDDIVLKNILVEDLCNIFEEENPNFNPSIFKDACK